jgi:hypothetical protein
MICLADNDIIKKLAICDLLEECLAVLDCGHSEMFVLPAARFVLGVAKDPDKARARLGAAAFDRLADFLGKVPVIQQPPDPQEQRLFDDIVGIDAGEAILFSATAAFSDFILATGDKRSLKALSTMEGAEAITGRLTGRVMCFEQIMVRIMNRYGFELLRNHAVPAVDCDIALSAVFGSGLSAVEANVRHGFTSYIEHLRRECGELLVAE